MPGAAASAVHSTRTLPDQAGACQESGFRRRLDRNSMKSRFQSWLLFCALVFLGVTRVDAAGPEYDLIIRGGKIVDGSGNPWFYGDVAAKGDRIAALGRVAGDAKRVIDASGLVVAPGFIDMHSHSDWTLLEDGNAQSKIHQGVTTEVIGESSSAGPFKGKLKPRSVSVKK